MKKIISILLTLLMTISIVPVATSASAETVGKVFFVPSPEWEGTLFYCHIFEADGEQGSFFGWQSKKEKLVEEDGKLYYDLSILDNELAQIQGGLKEGKMYNIMFSDNLGNETNSIMFNTKCIGDTAKVVTPTEWVENPVDSTKRSYGLEWIDNKDKYGVPLRITSVGTVQGRFIPVSSTIDDVINAWDREYPDYPNESAYSVQSNARTHKERLTELKTELKKMADNGEILYIGGEAYNDSTLNRIYFVPSQYWNGTIYFCHIYEADGEYNSFFGWQSKKEKLDFNGDCYYYNLDTLKLSETISGGLKEGKSYNILFSDNLGNETGSIMFNTDCVRDTAVVVDPTVWIENPVDSEKHSYDVEWVANKDKYGVPLQITSVGTIQGKFIAKGNTTANIIAQWDKVYSDYPNQSYYSPQSNARTHKDRLAEIKTKLANMAKNGEILYAGGGVYKDVVPVPTPHPVLKLTKNAGSIYVKGTMKTPYKVVEPYGKTTFSSSNTKVAKVNASGVITGVKAGKAVITVKHYKSSVKFTITVKNPTLNKKAVTLAKGKSFTLKVTGKIGKATFKTSNKKVATVNGSGKITVNKKAKKNQKAVITVKSNGIILKCTIKVK